MRAAGDSQAVIQSMAMCISFFLPHEFKIIQRKRMVLDSAAAWTFAVGLDASIAIRVSRFTPYSDIQTMRRACLHLNILPHTYPHLSF